MSLTRVDVIQTLYNCMIEDEIAQSLQFASQVSPRILAKFDVIVRDVVVEGTAVPKALLSEHLFDDLLRFPTTLRTKLDQIEADPNLLRHLCRLHAVDRFLTDGVDDDRRYLRR